MFRKYISGLFLTLGTFFLGVAGSVLASVGVHIATTEVLLVIVYMLVALLFGIAYFVTKEFHNLK